MKIAFVTGSRSDWNGTGMVAKAMAAGGHEATVIVTGQQAESPQTVKDDGFVPILSPIGWTSPTIGASDAIRSLAATLDALAPDLVFLAGDRYEALSAAFAATLLRLPIAHLAGGDQTLGSMDDRFRDAITAIARIHFVTHHRALERLMARFRKNDVIALAGSPALDRIRLTPILSKDETFAAVGLQPNPHNILVIFHPATALDQKAANAECVAMVHALTDLAEDSSFLILGSNADVGAHDIDWRLRMFAKTMIDTKCSAEYRANLSPQLFYSVMTHFDLMVGNSSAGPYESPSFGIPVVNIGDRQSGRLCAPNIRTCAATHDAISATLGLALGSGRSICENPYGDGHSTPRIVSALESFVKP